MDQTEFTDVVPIEIVKGDMLEVDWSDADIVYASSICFPDELVDGIAKCCSKLKKGTRIIALKEFPKDGYPYLKLDYNLKLKMTWGRCQVMIYSIVWIQ